MTLLHRRASARALLVMLAAATIVGAQPPKPFSAACPDAKPPRLDLHGDPLPEGAVVRLGTVRLRHGHIISGLVFAGDGKHIIASDYYSGVHVWDAAEGRELGRYYENDRYIHGLAISPDGRMLAVALSDLTVRLCDPISGQEFGALPPDHNRLSYLAFSPAGGRLATGTVGNTVRLWDVATRRLIQEVMGNESIGHAAFSPDGNLLAFDVRNGLVLWDIAHGKEVRQLPNEPGATHSLHAAFALRGGALAVWGYDDASVRLFDTSSFKEIRRFNNPAGAHVKPPYSWGWAHSMGVQFSPDGKLLAIVRSTGPIELWEVESGKKRHTLSFDRSRRTSFLAFSPDGTRLASGGGDNWGGDHTIRVWDVATGKELNARAGHGAPVSAVAVSPDGETVATAGRDGIVHLWERSSGKHLLRLAGDRCRRPHVAFARDGRRVFAWGDWDPAILRAWDPRSGAIVSKLELRGPDAMWETVSDDGKTALSFNMKGNSLRFHDLATGKVSREIAEAYRAVTLSPSGDHIVWLDGKLTKATDRKELMHVGNPDHPNPGAQFTPDGRRLMMAVISQAMLYSGANDPPAEEIVIIDPIERKVLRRFGKAPDHYFPIHAAAISNDGKMVATVGSEWQKPSEQIITLWETETGRERGRFVGHIGQANGVAITPDGRFVVTGADDTTALVWDASRSPSRGLIRQPTSDLAASFRDLAGDDARQASAAMWAMIDTPRETLAFLAKESSLFAVTDVQKIRRWIGNLDSETFAERDRAFQELGMILDESESHLKKALQARPSAEAHRRVNLLLQARSAGFSGRELQRSRVIELLEHIATPDATALLKRFAARPAEARVTEEAKASLARLRR